MILGNTTVLLGAKLAFPAPLPEIIAQLGIILKTKELFSLEDMMEKMSSVTPGHLLIKPGHY